MREVERSIPRYDRPGGPNQTYIAVWRERDEYNIRAGSWLRVDGEDFRAVTAFRTAEVCRVEGVRVPRRPDRFTDRDRPED